MGEPDRPNGLPARTEGPSAPRFLLVTVAITGLYLLLHNVWLVLMPTISALVEANHEDDWSREAVGVMSASRGTDAALPATLRPAAWRLGLKIGFLSEFLGVRSAEGQAIARRSMDPMFQEVERLAQAMGVGPVSLLPASSADDLARFDDRIEADELGLATRIESATSKRHRHLFLLGMHAGVALAFAQGSGGTLHNPKRHLIGRHATLAGVPASAWEPIAREPDGATGEEKLAACLAAISALDAEIATLQAWP